MANRCKALFPFVLLALSSSESRILQGTEDFTTPTSIGRAFVDGLDAAHKRFVTIKRGQFAVFMSSSEFMRK